MIGKRVGHVRIDSVLGAGGMGKVYLGWDEWLERRVAVKTLRTGKIHGQTSVARLRREARLLSRLDHPNVCRIYDLVEYQGRDLLLLEYIEGETLVEAARKDLTIDDKLRLGEEIALALAAAHQQKIIHRDLKPENVMVTDKGSVKVLDFGISLPFEFEGDPEAQARSTPISKTSGDPLPKTISFEPDANNTGVPTGSLTAMDRMQVLETRPGTVVGTLGYMSPEQAQGQEINEASDLYSFGILLQELFTGEPAYLPRKSVAESLLQVARGATKRPHNTEPEIAALLEDLLLLDADSRPTAEVAARRLHALRKRPERIRRSRRLRLAVLLALFVLIATIFVTHRIVAPRPLLATGKIARVAVLPFVNGTTSERNDWVEVGLSEIVIRILDAAEEVRVFPADRLRERLDRLGFDRERSLTPQQVERLTRDLGVFAIISTRLESLEGGSLLVSTILTRDGKKEQVQVRAPRPLEGADRLAAALASRFDPLSLVPELEESFSFDAFANQAYAIGRHELETSGAEVALPFFEVCLARDPEFLEADMMRAMARFRLGEWDEAQDELERIAAKADSRGDQKIHARALVHSATVALERGELELAENRYLEALSIQQAEGDEEIRAISLTRLAWIHFRRGDLDRAERALEESLELVNRLGLREQLPTTLTPWAYVALRRGDLEQAELRFRRVHELATEMGNHELEAGACLNLGTLLLQKGDLEEALVQVDRAKTSFEILGLAKGKLVAEINKGAILGELGRWSEALDVTRAAISQAREIGDGRSVVFSRAAAGYFATRLGKLGEAEMVLRQAQEGDWDRGDVDLAWQLDLDLAYLAIRQDRLEDAAAYLHKAQQRKEDPLNLRIAARLAYAGGRYEEAVGLDRQHLDANPTAFRSPLREEVSMTYQRSSETGRSFPLPDEHPIVSAQAGDAEN